MTEYMSSRSILKPRFRILKKCRSFTKMIIPTWSDQRRSPDESGLDIKLFYYLQMNSVKSCQIAFCAEPRRLTKACCGNHQTSRQGTDRKLAGVSPPFSHHSSNVTMMLLHAFCAEVLWPGPFLLSCHLSKLSKYFPWVHLIDSWAENSRDIRWQRSPCSGAVAASSKAYVEAHEGSPWWLWMPFSPVELLAAGRPPEVSLDISKDALERWTLSKTSGCGCSMIKSVQVPADSEKAKNLVLWVAFSCVFILQIQTYFQGASVSLLGKRCR